MMRKITPEMLILCLCLICVGCSGKSVQGIQATPTANQAMPVVNMVTVKGEYAQQPDAELRNWMGRPNCIVIGRRNSSRLSGHNRKMPHPQKLATQRIITEMKDRLAEQVPRYQQVLRNKTGVGDKLIVPSTVSVRSKFIDETSFN
jgi:hypothetical protein